MKRSKKAPVPKWGKEARRGKYQNKEFAVEYGCLFISVFFHFLSFGCKNVRVSVGFVFSFVSSCLLFLDGWYVWSIEVSYV
jgi:hypothetical protein